MVMANFIIFYQFSLISWRSKCDFKKKESNENPLLPIIKNCWIKQLVWSYILVENGKTPESIWSFADEKKQQQVPC